MMNFKPCTSVFRFCLGQAKKAIKCDFMLYQLISQTTELISITKRIDLKKMSYKKSLSGWPRKRSQNVMIMHV